MPPDRPEWSRDGRDSPYNRQRDDARRRERSRSRERDREWGYDRRSPPQRRRSPSRERGDKLPRRRSRTRSPPSRDERDSRERLRLSPRNEGKSRGSSRSRSPPKRRPTSPGMNDSQRYRREYPSGPSRQGYDSQQGGYEYGGSMRGRGGWRGSSYPYPSRGGYQPRQYDAPHLRDQSDMSRGPPSAPYSSQYISQNLEPPPSTSSASTNQGPSDPSTPAAPSGPASWRRAQQYRQERPPYQQDYRPNFSTPRAAPPINPVHRNAPRTPFSHPPQSPLEKSPYDPVATSPTLNRPIPTGPRASLGSLVPTQQHPPVKKEYISPVADLDEKRAKLKSEYEKLEAKDWEIQKRKRAAIAEWTFLDRESKREAVKVDMAEKLLEATVNGTVFVT